MDEKDLNKRLSEVIEPLLEQHGMELVKLHFHKGPPGLLRIFIDRSDYTGVTLDDCALVSREAGILLDVENLLASRYRLEVSSPGLDRPLTRLKDFSHFQGKKARVRYRDETGAPRTVKGVISDVQGELVTIPLSEGTLPEGLLKIDFNDIASASLEYEWLK